MAWLDSQELGRNTTGKLVENVGKEVCGYTFPNRQKIKMKILVSNVNDHQMVMTSTEECFIIEGTAWSLLWIPVSLFAQPPLSSPTGLVNKVAMVAGMMVIYRFSKMGFYSPRMTWIWSPLSTQYVSTREPTLSPNIVPLSRGNQPASQWQVDSTGLLPPWKGWHSVLNGIYSYSGYRLPSLHNASAKIITHGLTECLIHCHVYHCTLLPTRKLISQPQKGSHKPIWNSLISPCSPPSWTSWLDRMLKWSFEDSVTVPAGWQYLVGLRHGSPEGCIVSESVTHIWYCLFNSQQSQVQEARDVNRNVTTLIPLGHPLATFLIPSSTASCSAGQKVLNTR